jgi:hypothetical protein
LSCAELADQARERHSLRVADADRRCSADADCGLANVSVECVVDCGEPVSVAQTALQALESDVRLEADGGPCGTLLDRPCPLPTVDCEQRAGTPEPFCNAGACALRYLNLQ